jgi:acyl-CoA reductase-like NAD-dependent aldehyde dehydrogenase
MYYRTYNTFITIEPHITKKYLTTFQLILRRSHRILSSMQQKQGNLSSTSGITEYTKQYINGEWITSTNGAQSLLDVFDSNTGQVFARAPKGSTADTARAIEAASDAFKSWSRTTLAERKIYLQKILQEYMKRQKEVGAALQKELGAPKVFAERVQSNMFNMHWATTLALAEPGAFAWTEDMGNTLLVKEPIGVVGCITPWNWPLNQIAAKIAPALLAGCTVVLKPSEITPINAILVAEAIHAVGLPKGVFNMVMGTGPETAELLSTHPKVDMVSFTGSTRVGRLLHANGAESIKRVRTELGGKSATVILDDATPTQIAAMAGHVIGNTGQSCNALSRMLVPESRYEEAVSIAKKVFESVTVTNAMGGKMGDIGPLASQMQFDKVTGYIQKGIDEGARLVTGGPSRPDGFDHGYFVQPTIFADVNNQMSIAREEIFGPVLSIIPYKTEEEAIDIANDTIYGLNNGVASADMDRAIAVASQLRSGQVQINTPSGGAGAMVPFGGYKQSGDGREWGSHGLEEFLQVKAINKPKMKKSKL